MRESRQLEFKSDITNTFLKTVSAFANYDGGQILFGVAENGDVVGLADPEQVCLDIENKINDTIRPQPQYKLSNALTSALSARMPPASATTSLSRSNTARSSVIRKR